jgi:hypothetical protein
MITMCSIFPDPDVLPPPLTPHPFKLSERAPAQSRRMERQANEFLPIKANSRQKMS